jgi:hypothetical protein
MPGAEPDPDVLLQALRDEAGEPPLPPLRIADPAPSAREGVSGRAVGESRRAVMRLITPALADLLAQLEADRHRMQAEIRRLEARIAYLEKRVPADTDD